MFIESGLTAASLAESSSSGTKISTTLGRNPNVPAATANQNQVPIHLAESGPPLGQHRHPWLKPSSTLSQSESLKSGISGQRTGRLPQTRIFKKNNFSFFDSNQRPDQLKRANSNSNQNLPNCEYTPFNPFLILLGRVYAVLPNTIMLT